MSSRVAYMRGTGRTPSPLGQSAPSTPGFNSRSDLGTITESDESDMSYKKSRNPKRPSSITVPISSWEQLQAAPPNNHNPVIPPIQTPDADLYDCTGKNVELPAKGMVSVRRMFSRPQRRPKVPFPVDTGSQQGWRNRKSRYYEDNPVRRISGPSAPEAETECPLVGEEVITSDDSPTETCTPSTTGSLSSGDLSVISSPKSAGRRKAWKPDSVKGSRRPSMASSTRSTITSVGWPGSVRSPNGSCTSSTPTLASSVSSVSSRSQAESCRGVSESRPTSPPPIPIPPQDLVKSLQKRTSGRCLIRPVGSQPQSSKGSVSGSKRSASRSSGKEARLSFQPGSERLTRRPEVPPRDKMATPGNLAPFRRSASSQCRSSGSWSSSDGGEKPSAQRKVAGAGEQAALDYREYLERCGIDPAVANPSSHDAGYAPLRRQNTVQSVMSGVHSLKRKASSIRSSLHHGHLGRRSLDSFRSSPSMYSGFSYARGDSEQIEAFDKLPHRHRLFEDDVEDDTYASLDGVQSPFIFSGLPRSKSSARPDDRSFGHSIRSLSYRLADLRRDFGGGRTRNKLRKSPRSASAQSRPSETADNRSIRHTDTNTSSCSIASGKGSFKSIRSIRHGIDSAKSFISGASRSIRGRRSCDDNPSSGRESRWARCFPKSKNRLQKRRPDRSKHSTWSVKRRGSVKPG